MTTDALADLRLNHVEWYVTDAEASATDFVDKWEDLPVGVDTEGPLSQFYGQPVLDALQSGPENFTRWGITQGQGDLIGASLGELPVATAIAATTSGGVDAAGAAKQAADALQTLKDSLG